MVKILLHRVATHKIHISTNEANFINSQIITISCFSITCLNSIPLYKRKCSHYHYYITSVTNSTIYHKSPSPSDNLWQSALLHYNGNTLLLTGFEVSSWSHSLLGSLSSLLGNHWSSALNFCTWNMWYDSGLSLWKLGCSWNPTYFSFWTFPFQSGLLFPVGHTLLPLSGILLDSHSYNFGRCDLLLHMNSMTWCRL